MLTAIVLNVSTSVFCTIPNIGKSKNLLCLQIERQLISHRDSENEKSFDYSFWSFLDPFKERPLFLKVIYNTNHKNYSQHFQNQKRDLTSARAACLEMKECYGVTLQLNDLEKFFYYDYIERKDTRKPCEYFLFNFDFIISIFQFSSRRKCFTLGTIESRKQEDIFCGRRPKS